MWRRKAIPKTNILILNLIIILNLLPNVLAQEYCYTSGGVFGLIILSVFTTLFVIALTFALFWFLWTKNLLKLDFVLRAFETNKSGLQKKANDLESGRVKEDFAFDNPYFEDEEDGHKPTQTYNLTNNSHQENSLNKLQTLSANHNQTNSQRILREKDKNLINNRFVKSLPLSAVFNNIHILNKKCKPENHSLDDTYIQEKAERLDVDLIGHDFTGLGFNICGNMRDGIFVKDVLNRGPANESRKVKAGDKIISVCVSFESMVFEDAVAILSYASPYNVKIGIEKSAQYYAIVEKLTNTVNANHKLTSTTDKSLLHPLYRSHSVDDLTQITKETSLSEKSTNSDSNNVIQRIKTQILNKINLKHLNTDHNTRKCAEPEPFNSHNDSLEVKEVSIEMPEIDGSNTDRVDQIDSSVDNIVTQFKDNINESQIQEKSDVETETIKKLVIPAKRKGKAPQPPIDVTPLTASDLSLVSSNVEITVETIETTAQIHNEEISKEQPFVGCDEMNDEKVDEMITDESINEDMTDNNESISSSDNTYSKDVVLVPLRSNSPQRGHSPTGKAKSSSMSDLTNNNEKLQSVLLERAVSLDMKGQSLPEENLNHIHTKNLLILNNESVDSMPIINWSSNKPLISDTNSSESTLNETNAIFLSNSEMYNSFDTNIITELNAKDISFDTNESKTSESDEHTFVSQINVEVPLMSSTPLKTNQSVATEEGSHGSDIMDSSLSSYGMESPELTIIDSKQSFSVNDCTENNANEEVVETNNNNKTKEVIELTESELNGVMMSHKQFLQKKAKTNGSYPTSRIPVKIPVKTSLIETPLESLDFESWSYLSEDENSNPTQTQTQNDSTLYRTALDVSLSPESNIPVRTSNLPEISGITLKTGESEPIFISTNDSLDSSFTSSSSSPSK